MIKVPTPEIKQTEEEKLLENHLNEVDRDSAITGTIQGFKDLKATREWKDITDALEGMLEQLHLAIMIEFDMDNVKRMQGKALMLAFLHDMPDELIDELKTDQQLREEDEEDENL